MNWSTETFEEYVSISMYKATGAGKCSIRDSPITISAAFGLSVACFVVCALNIMTEWNSNHHSCSLRVVGYLIFSAGLKFYDWMEYRLVGVYLIHSFCAENFVHWNSRKYAVFSMWGVLVRVIQVVRVANGKVQATCITKNWSTQTFR